MVYETVRNPNNAKEWEGRDEEVQETIKSPKQYQRLVGTRRGKFKKLFIYTKIL